MKYCKGKCGKILGIMQEDYCKECKKKLPLIERYKRTMEKQQTKIGDEK